MTISKFFDICGDVDLRIFRDAFDKVQLFATLSNFEGVFDFYTVDSENEIENGLDIINNRFISALEDKIKIRENLTNSAKRTLNRAKEER